jgi:hypothetical protein
MMKYLYYNMYFPKNITQGHLHKGMFKAKSHMFLL